MAFWHALLDLLSSFGQIGLFALGGGDSMLKMIGDESVVHRHWLTADQYGALLAMDYLFPGLTAAKIAGVIGYRVAGIAGLLTAVLALNLPGIILVAIGFTLTVNHIDHPIVQKILEAMKFGAMAMIAAVLFDMMHSAAAHGHGSLLAIALTLLFFIALEFFDAPVIGGLVTYVAVFLGLHLCGLPI
ncbi:MAG TPA: chromate transporter [Xanthobacteraceae bacterium]|nr:chromate transporter [Xanthobacteraceae bacterium]